MLQIRKKTDDIWEHIDTVTGRQFILSDFYVESEVTDGFQIKEIGGSQRILYAISNVTVYDDTDGGTPETFANQVDLFARLFALQYPAFDYTDAISALYQLKSNISQDIDADQASTTKYPSTKEAFDFVTAFILAANNWTKTGNDIQNNNVEDVIIKLLDGFQLQGKDVANVVRWYIAHNGLASFSQLVCASITGNGGGLPAITSFSTGGVDGTWKISQIYYTNDHSADTNARRLVDRGEIDPYAIIYDDNRHGNSLDMSGNSISGVSSISAASGDVTNAPVNPTDIVRLQELTDLHTEYPETAYGQTVTWTGTAPTGTPTANWRATRIGKHVSLRMNVIFPTPGVTLTAAFIPLPTGVPLPSDISGFTTGINNVVAFGTGSMITATNTTGGTARVLLRRIGSGNFDIIVVNSSGAYSGFVLSIDYFID